MKNPRDFPKSLAMLQITDTSLYIVTAVVVYRYVGSDVSSPALGSAGPLMSRVSYGLAIPTVRRSLPRRPCRHHLILGTGHYCRSYLWTRRVQVHLRPYLPWLGPVT